jgi:hypothetical protein
VKEIAMKLESGFGSDQLVQSSVLKLYNTTMGNKIIFYLSVFLSFWPSCAVRFAVIFVLF